MARLPHVVITNDDGVGAPGLVALANALASQKWCRTSICGPAEERSAQSHALTLSRVMVATAITKVAPGVQDAYAVHGTPADSVMLALHSSILSDRKVDLLVSGINRGENCGLHVVYSGTVGAAREAAIAGVPSIAISLDDYAARTVDQYVAAATHCLPLIKGMLGLLPVPGPAPPLKPGYILNVNVPGPGMGPIVGYAWAAQGSSCATSSFEEIMDNRRAAAAVASANGSGAATAGGGAAAAGEGVQQLSATSTSMDIEGVLQVPGTREFARHVNPISHVAPGTDLAAVRSGHVSLTPLGLLQHVPHPALPGCGTQQQADQEAAHALGVVAQAAAKATGLPLVGL